MKKTIFIFVLTALLLSLNLAAYAQSKQLSHEHAARLKDSIARNAPIVFEGHLVAKRPIEYVGRDKQAYYSYLVEVEKVLRGNLKTGIIELQVPSDNLVDSAGHIIRQYNSCGGFSIAPRSYNEYCTFFCQTTDYKTLSTTPNLVADTQFSFFSLYGGYNTYYEHMRLKGLPTDNSVNWLLGGYKSLEDYQDWLALYGLAPSRKSIKIPQKKSQNQKKRDEINRLAPKAADLILDFANPQTNVISNAIYFEFDIRASCQVGSSTLNYLDSLQLYLDYSTLAFGRFLANNSGATMTLSVPTANQNSYQPIAVSNSDSNTLRIKLAPKVFTSSTAYNRFKIPISIYVPLIHVKLKLYDCQAAKGVDWAAVVGITGVHVNSSWANFKTAANSLYTTASQDYSLSLQGGNLLNTRVNSACSAQGIISFSPLDIRAGFGDTLTLTDASGHFGYIRLLTKKS